jgi:hypothetical protein
MKPQKKSRAPREGTAFRDACLVGIVSSNSENLPRRQADYLTARFRLDGARARLVAELAWGRA